MREKPGMMVKRSSQCRVSFVLAYSLHRARSFIIMSLNPGLRQQVELSVPQRIRKVLGSYSSASNVLIKMRSNWCLMKPSLRSKVRYSGAPSTIVFRPTSQHRCSIPHLWTDLWNDVYGNFILQKLLEFGTDDMKESIANRLASDSLTLSTRVYVWWVWHCNRCRCLLQISVCTHNITVCFSQVE